MFFNWESIFLWFSPPNLFDYSMLRDYLLIRFKKFAAGARQRKADPKVKGQHFPCGGYKLSVGEMGYCVRGVQLADANTTRLEM